MSNPELVTYLLTQIENEPLEKRVRLYRLFVLEISDRALQASVRALADELEQIERKHRQLVLDFKRRAG